MHFTAHSSVTGVIPSSNCSCNLCPHEDTLFCNHKTKQVSLALCSVQFVGTVCSSSQEIQRSLQYCKEEIFLLMGVLLHNWLMVLPPSWGKCSHYKSGAVRFHLKLFTVLFQLMFLLWLLPPYLSLFVSSSTIAPVSFPYGGFCVSFQSVPFPKHRKKKSYSVVSRFYSTNPSFKSASSITSTYGSPEW